MPVLLIIGGSQGSVAVNTAVRKILPTLLKSFRVIHLCGKGNLDETLADTTGYVQFEYIQNELPDLFAASDVVISRAGANAICELLALRKPAILIPLPLSASRGDQILNAKSFAAQGFSMMLEDENVNDASLLSAIREVYDNRAGYIHAMETSDLGDPVGTIIGLIEDAVNERQST